MSGRSWRISALAAVLVLELAVIAALVLRYEWRLWHGRPVVLLTIPVDPRDLFRGDYVILDYDLTLPDAVEENEAGQGCRDHDLWLVFRQSQDALSDLLRVDKAVPAVLADDEAVLKVKDRCWRGIEFSDSIRRYYVAEGTGHDLETAIRTGEISVVLATTPEGEAASAALRVGNVTVSDERLF